ncbi:zf-HC2 domain-containing protein [Corallococcus carmarthensis]|uniref:Zf-HC2 domain-containing protein n=1 Tax=Corallococcus carmarthensis TaxID=2316728 RepID=A0A3A8KHS0_9BACT|nr:zf-HC2 domain-containing protein [Corallococcus carmarthensis]NOK15429.1 zf-HC2 domain-containing protein [Corallococcus carmarthensis]RKH07748.1 zf-HC2 domain-containing protein [Corallococcus carmarthensis]
MSSATSHLTRERTEQYLLGALPPEAEAELEAHTLTCEPCARLLQEEALLEEQLYEVAAATPRDAVVVRPARWHRPAAVAAALVAVAASVFLLLRPGGEAASTPVTPLEAPVVAVLDVDEAPRDIVVACPDLATQEHCLRSASARGLLVYHPGGQGEVPRYDASSGRTPVALNSRPAAL